MVKIPIMIGWEASELPTVKCPQCGSAVHISKPPKVTVLVTCLNCKKTFNPQEIGESNGGKK